MVQYKVKDILEKPQNGKRVQILELVEFDKANNPVKIKIVGLAERRHKHIISVETIAKEYANLTALEEGRYSK